MCEERPVRPEAAHPKTVVRAGDSSDDARDVEAVVVEEHGRWAVELVVIFTDGVVRTRICTYATKARAELAASLIKRVAERDLRGPLNG